MSSINELKTVVGGGGATWSGSVNKSDIMNSSFTFNIPVDSSTKVVNINLRVYSYTSSSSSSLSGFNISLNDVYIAKNSNNSRISQYNGTNIFTIYGLVDNGTLNGIVEANLPSMSDDGKSNFNIVEGAISVPISNNKIILLFSYGEDPSSYKNNISVMAYTL